MSGLLARVLKFLKQMGREEQSRSAGKSCPSHCPGAFRSRNQWINTQDGSKLEPFFAPEKACMSKLPALFTAPLWFSLLLLSGCGLTPATSPRSSNGNAVSGNIHGGQQPVAGAAI